MGIGTDYEYEQFAESFSRESGKPHKIIMGLYRGHTGSLIKASFFQVLQRSPVWVIPIVTSSIINIATDKTEDGVVSILIYLGIASFFLLQNLPTAYMGTKYYSTLNRHIEEGLRSVLIRKIQYLSVMFHKEMQSGRLQSKIVRDVENIYELLNQLFKTLLFFVLDISIIIAVCSMKSPIVLVFFLTAAPISILILQKFKKPIKEHNYHYRNEVELTQGAIAQMIDMIPITRAHGLQEVEIDKMNERLAGISDRGLKLDMVNAFFGASNWITFQLIQVVCLTFTSILAYNEKISIGEVVLYQTYFTQLLGQISNLINIYPNITKGAESLRSIGSILEEGNVETNNAIVEIGNLKGDVTFSDVSFKFPDSSKLVLDDLSLDIKHGESVALVGESGGGKSTVLNLIIGFMQPDSGRILIDGINMNNLNMSEYRSQIAVVPQNTVLFDGSIKDNIAYGIKKVSDEEINRIISEVGLDDMVNQLPEGIHTKLGGHGDKLSGGQKQRISIARALIRKPKIIIFDEATSALDNASEKLVQKATERMMKQCTTFIVAHRLSTIRNVDRIVVMSQGKMVESGTYEELMAKKGHFFNLEK